MKKLLKILLATTLCVCFCLPTMAGCAKETSDLKIGFYDGGYGTKWAKKLASDFMEANPGVEVKVEADKEIVGKIDGYLKNNKNSYDILFSHGISWELAAIQGQLEPLDDLFATEVSTGVTVEDRLLDIFVPETKYKGKGDTAARPYKLPWTNGVGGLVYNTKMFADNNWKVPATYDELVALCQAIEDKALPSPTNRNETIKPFVFSQEIYYWDYLVFDWMMQLCGEEEFNSIRELPSSQVFNPETSKVAQAQQQALELWSNIVAEKPDWSMTGSKGKTYLAAQSDFINGNAAMMPNAQWVENEMSESLDPDTTVMALMPAPLVAGAKTDASGKAINYSRTLAGSGGDSIIIPANSKHKEMAKKFLAFMCEEQNAINFSVNTGGAMLGLDYDKAKLDAVPNKTEFMTSVFDINASSTKFSMYSPSILRIGGKIPFEWFAGKGRAPYGDLITKPDTNIPSIFTDYYASVNSSWANWLDELA